MPVRRLLLFWPVLVLFGLGWWLGAAAPAGRAQVANGIGEPAPGEVVAGVVTIAGTARDPAFLRYELAFYAEANPDAGWIVFAEGDQPVTAGPLALWDTTVGRQANAPVFPDGRYRLRLRVVRSDYNYDEYVVGDLAVANDAPTPTPTDETPALEATRAPAGTPLATAPAVLPSLTPFPTPTPRATPADRASGASPAPTGDGGGWLSRLSAIDWGQFSRAFWQGARFTGYLFAGLAGYLLVRNGLRWFARWLRHWLAQRRASRDLEERV